MPRLILRRAIIKREDGSALVSVVGIVLLTIVIATAVAATTISSLNRTDETRDIVAAEYAAEAGVSVVQAAIASGSCMSPVFETTGSAPPFYRAVVQHKVSGVLVTGCPTGGEDVRIVSTGYDTKADFDAKTGMFRSVEALYGQVPQPFAPSGPAVFAHGNISLSQGSTVLPTPDQDVTLMSYTGDVFCSQSGTGAADIVVMDGGFKATNTCTIGGNLWLTGTPTGPAPTDGSLIAGQASLSNSTSVGGKLVAHSLVIPNNHSGSLGPLYADVTSGVAASQLTDHGPVSSRASAGAAPKSVPDWLDFNYVPSDWVGFDVVQAGGCTSSAINQVMASRAGTKVVIDALHCDWLTLDKNLDLSITADLAIFARSFVLKQAKISGTGAQQLWLVTPDDVKDGSPTCGSYAGSNGIEIDDSLELTTHTAFPDVSVMFYTPCALSFKNPIHIDGQIYAADVDGGNQLSFSFSPGGLPNQNLDTGEEDAPLTAHAIASYLNTTTTAESIIGGTG